MPERSYTSREELDQYGFHPGVTVLAPLVCILLQAMLPKTFPWLIHIGFAVDCYDFLCGVAA